MVDIAPFRALRYAGGKKGNDISKVICPPYDVISSEERAALIDKSATNIVQVELPSGAGREKYANARELLRSWQEIDVLQKDREPAFYLLETSFQIKDAFAPGSRLKRYGVLVALHMETPGRGAIHPHERTLPKAKEDRLSLLQSVQTNVSPIFGLFFDKKDQWSRWVRQVVKSAPISKGKEKSGLEHRMWKVDTPRLQNELKRLVRPKDLYIADGHHRYEVAWAYKEERLQAEPRAGLECGWHRVLCYVCPMEEAGLLMLPTHRLVHSTKTLSDWRTHLESFFDILPMEKFGDVVKLLAKPRSDKERLIGWATRGGTYVLKLRKDISIDRCLSHRPAALKGLDVVLLHDLALGEAPEGEFLKEKEVIYTRDLLDIQKKTTADTAWVGFLLSSPGVKAMANVASAGEVMPPKTTYFYPKVPTGFALMPLNQKCGGSKR